MQKLSIAIVGDEVFGPFIDISFEGMSKILQLDHKRRGSNLLSIRHRELYFATNYKFDTSDSCVCLEKFHFDCLKLTTSRLTE